MASKGKSFLNLNNITKMSDFFLFPKPAFDFDRNFLAEKLKEKYIEIKIEYVNDSDDVYELAWYYMSGKRYIDGYLRKEETCLTFVASHLEVLAEFVIWIRKITGDGIPIALMDESAAYEIEILSTMSEKDVLKALEENRG